MVGEAGDEQVNQALLKQLGNAPVLRPSVYFHQPGEIAPKYRPYLHATTVRFSF